MLRKIQQKIALTKSLKYLVNTQIPTVPGRLTSFELHRIARVPGFARHWCSNRVTDIQIPVAQYEEVKNLLKHPEKLLVDVREPRELDETGLIPTSINIPLGEVAVALQPNGRAEHFFNKYGREKPKLSTEVIFTCRSGKRAQDAAELAASLGYTNVKNYKGSWIDWANREGLSA